MTLLLDTHAVLWWLTDDERLGGRARGAIEYPRTEVLVSVVSRWEIVLKARVGKLQADVGQVWDAILTGGFTVIDIGIRHLLALSAMPIHRRDPVDHLLMA